MMKKSEWVKGWVRYLRMKHKCYLCGLSVSDQFPARAWQHMDMMVCDRCYNRPFAKLELDLDYWARYPHRTPLCQHCDGVVTAETAVLAVCQGWYFCERCASNPKILAYHRYLQVGGLSERARTRALWE